MLKFFVNSIQTTTLYFSGAVSHCRIVVLDPLDLRQLGLLTLTTLILSKRPGGNLLQILSLVFGMFRKTPPFSIRKRLVISRRGKSKLSGG
jgi:hypothetical protein